MANKIKFPHVCPKCEKTTASNQQELEEKFGMRNMKNNSGEVSHSTNQSWCKVCRSKN